MKWNWSDSLCRLVKGEVCLAIDGRYLLCFCFLLPCACRSLASWSQVCTPSTPSWPSRSGAWPPSARPRLRAGTTSERARRPEERWRRGLSWRETITHGTSGPMKSHRQGRRCIHDIPTSFASVFFFLSAPLPPPFPRKQRHHHRSSRGLSASQLCSHTKIDSM